MDEEQVDAQDAIEASRPADLAQRLREARIQKGLRQEDVAEKLGVARTTVINIEKALRRIRPAELMTMAEIYGRTLNELLRPTPPPEPLAVQFRLAPSQKSDDLSLRNQIEELERLCDDYLELERIMNAPLVRREPEQYTVEGLEQAAEEVAAAERSRLSLGDGPLMHLREMLEEEAGMRVFALNLPSGVAGLFAYTKGIGPCVAFNRNHPSGRQVLSLAHEYGHYLTTRDRAEVTVLRTSYQRIPESERFADAFGRYFLMPSGGVIRLFNNLKRSRAGRLTRGDLVRLAHLYRVSLQAMVLRLEELRLVRPGTWDQIEISGFKLHEAQRLLDLSPEPPDERLLPSRYIQLGVEAFRNGLITEGQLARFLRVDRLEARDVVRKQESQYGLDERGNITNAELDLFQA